MRAREVVALGVLAVLGVATACGTATLGPRDEGPGVTEASTILLPTLPAPPAETVTIEEQATTAATSGAAAREEPVGDGLVYFMRYDRIEAEPVRFSSERADPARAALDLLLAGPSPAQRSLRFWTAIPDGTRVRSLVVADDVATVDLSGEFDDFAGASSLTALGPANVVAMYQVVATLTERQDVQRVLFQIDGVPYDPYFGGVPITRDMLERALDEGEADISFSCTPDADPQPLGTGERPFGLGAPANGTVVADGQPISVTGTMRLPDDVIVFRLIQFRTEVRHAVSPPGCEGTFTAELTVPPSLVGPVTLDAYVPREDGTKRYQVLRDLSVE